jgi:hypothetical protein
MTALPGTPQSGNLFAICQVTLLCPGDVPLYWNPYMGNNSTGTILHQRLFFINRCFFFPVMVKEHLPVKPAQDIFEIGFHIRAKHWGSGFATEAALGVMNYAFNVLSVSGLFAGHNPHNIASRHILLKLGFRFIHDEYYAPTGLYHPSYMLTADEYRRMQRRVEGWKVRK